MKRLIFTLTILCLSAFYGFSTEQFIYTRISQDEGLTSTVNCIHKEKDGDVWIGTPNGLFRFDGNSLTRREESFLDGLINNLMMDSNGNLWVLTSNGLVCRNKDEEDFTQIPLAEGKDNQAFHSLCEDEEGLWMGGYGKIYRFTHSTGKLEVFKSLDDRPMFICRDISFLDDRTLLCSSLNGIILIDTITGDISDAPFCPRREIVKSLIDSKGNIWLSLYNNGLEIYDKDGHLIKRISSKTGLSNDIVLCMAELNGRIWVGTDGGGINIIDLNQDRITVLSHISGDNSSLPAHSIKSIYVDDYKNVWAGSVRDGLIRISRSGMKTYTDVHIGMNNGLSNPTVLCLYQDRNSDMIWIGTDGEGINRFNPVSNEFTHYKSTLDKKVVSIAGYSDTELAVSVFSDRIWIFNKITGTMRPLEIDDTYINYQIQYSGLSINLYNEGTENLLLLGNILKRYDKTTGVCTDITVKGGHVSKGNLGTIGKDKRGIWIHDAYSLYLLREDSDTMEMIADIGCLIRSGHISMDGIMWLATEKGLCRFDIKNSCHEFISTDLFSEASSVICDNKSRVWVGTNTGVFAYLPDFQRFALFGASDGASPNDFLPKPHLLSDKGEVYLGGVKGLLYIDNSYSIESDEKILIRLNRLEMDHNSINLNKDLKYTVPSDCKSLSIGVNVQEKDLFREKRFRFYLTEDNVVETTSADLLLHQIPAPGTYEIKVSCTKRNGEWSKPAHILTLRILRPWYLSWWFFILIGLSVAGLSFLIIINIRRRNANRKKLAQKEQEQLVYEEKVRVLINISHELRTPLTLIIAPLKRLLNKMEPGDEHFSTMNRIYRQSRRMKELLNMVLDLRKMEVEKNKVVLEKVRFNRWVAAEIEDFALEVKSEGIDVVFNPDSSLEHVVMDMKKCETIMMNIMINAVKHSSKGETITVSTQLTERGMARVSICDQGPGLGEIDPSKLFTRFYHGNREQYGSGIGLSYSKVLVELQGGKIGAFNNDDKGATFWWEIPLDKASEIDGEIVEKAYLNELLGHDVDFVSDDILFDTSKSRIMIVDDSKDLLVFLKESFEDAFAEVMTITSGNKALGILASGKLPDIIVSDVNMNDGDGFRLCSEVKNNEKYSHIPFILLTARGGEQSQSDSYRAGADAFLAKPFETETLMHLICSLLQKRQSIKKKYLDTSGTLPADYSANEESLIIKLNSIISKNLSNPDLDQQLLCRELGMSRATLFNKMKAISGSGVKEYITRIRIEEAKRLLETDSLSLSEISEMTGFASQSYFSTAFKASTGMTPSQYKKLRSEAPEDSTHSQSDSPNQSATV